MTKEEALQKIKELEEYIKDSGQSVGYEDDEIFLLSAEEYEKYKWKISTLRGWWWLRSPGGNQFSVACVNHSSSVDYSGHCVDIDNDCVRPALKISDSGFKNIKIGDRYVKYDFPWIKIDESLAIAEVPIGFYRFDKCSNDYEKSEIRKYINEWKEQRK